MLMNTVRTPSPAKLPKVFSPPSSPVLPPRLMITVRAIIPRISSITAAPKMAFPALEFKTPNSFNVSTVILTDVAVMITPMNIFCQNRLDISGFCSVLKKCAKKKPPPSGTNTPSRAMTNDASPAFFSSCKSVSRPALNIRTITPNSAKLLIREFRSTTSSNIGPKIMPAANAPTTCGKLIRFVTNPNNFVANKMMAICNR